MPGLKPCFSPFMMTYFVAEHAKDDQICRDVLASPAALAARQEAPHGRGTKERRRGQQEGGDWVGSRGDELGRPIWCRSWLQCKCKAYWIVLWMFVWFGGICLNTMRMERTLNEPCSARSGPTRWTRIKCVKRLVAVYITIGFCTLHTLHMIRYPTEKDRKSGPRGIMVPKCPKKAPQDPVDFTRPQGGTILQDPSDTAEPGWGPRLGLSHGKGSVSIVCTYLVSSAVVFMVFQEHSFSNTPSKRHQKTFKIFKNPSETYWNQSLNRFFLPTLGHFLRTPNLGRSHTSARSECPGREVMEVQSALAILAETGSSAVASLSHQQTHGFVGKWGIPMYTIYHGYTNVYYIPWVHWYILYTMGILVYTIYHGYTGIPIRSPFFHRANDGKHVPIAIHKPFFRGKMSRALPEEAQRAPSWTAGGIPFEWAESVSGQARRLLEMIWHDIPAGKMVV